MVPGSSLLPVARLVKINSPEENQFVVNLVRQQALSLRQVWIALKANTATFFWSDQSVPVFKNWASIEPLEGLGSNVATGMITAPASPNWLLVCYFLPLESTLKQRHSLPKAGVVVIPTS